MFFFWNWNLTVVMQHLRCLSNSLGPFDGGIIRPEDFCLFAIFRHQDVLCSHEQSDAKLGMNDSKAPKVGIHRVLRVYLLVPDGLTIYRDTLKKKVTLKNLRNDFWESWTTTFPLTYQRIFDQVKDGAWFVIDIEAECIILVCKLNDEVWIWINCYVNKINKKTHYFMLGHC